ncbi:ATP-binding protein [Blastococcus sp. SYSU D00820]
MSGRPESEAGAARDRALRGTGVLGTVPEERFDRIARLAARLLGVPMAMVNLVTGQDQWTKARHGIEADRTPLEDSICRHSVESGSRLEVSDLTADERFRDNTFVTAEPRVRFYAGEPLAAGGVPVGTLCVLDTRPRELTEDQREVLAELAAWAEAELNNSTLNDLVARLRDREYRFRRLLDAAPEGVLIVDGDGTVRPENAAASAMFGLAGDGAADLGRILPGSSPDRPPFAHRRRDDRTAVTRLQTTGRATDDQRFPVEITVTRLEGADADQWLLLTRDLRPVQDAESGLRRQERVTAMVLRSAGDGIVGSDRDGVVVFANPAATRILGCRESDLVGSSLHEVAHHSYPDGSPFPAAECRTHRAISQAVAVEARQDVFWRRDGRPVPVEMSVAPILDGAELLGAVTTFRDVSDRLEVERLKDEFVGVVSHELRTPLTSITGSLSLLAHGVAGPLTPAQEPLVDMARRNADRLTTLVNDILDLDRLDAGRMPLRPVPTDMAALAGQVVAALQPVAQVAGVDLTAEAPGDGTTTVEVDPDRMAQVLANLVGNAVKFSHRGAPVTVAVERRGGEIRTAVRDRGPGIPADQLESVFERFRQVDDPAGNRSGSGLGLSIAKGIAERSGGRIELTSEVGRGSTFTVVLPAAPPDPSGGEQT